MIHQSGGPNGSAFCGAEMDQGNWGRAITCPDCSRLLWEGANRREQRIERGRRACLDAIAQGENPDFDDIRAALGIPDPE